MVDREQLSRFNRVLRPERAQLFATIFSQVMPDGGITTPRRIGHFFAQAAQETGGLISLVESTAYKDPARLDRIFSNVQGAVHAQRLINQGPQAIGNTIYANKNGNGNIASGDGFRFRGRGFLQITGRGNYRRVGKMIGMPLEEQPDMLGEPLSAARAAIAYWKARHINTPADADDISTVTLLVNGPARLHLTERTAWLEKAKTIWRVDA